MKSEDEITVRNRQGVFIGVTVAVIVVSGLLFFFPENPENNVKQPELRAQVIIPRTSSPRKATPPAGNSEPTFSRRPTSPYRNSSQGQIVRNRSATPNRDEIWQVIYLGEKRIGYSHTKFQKLGSGSDTRIHVTSELQMSVLRFGQVTRMSVRSESVEQTNGDLLSFNIVNNNGRTISRMEGKVRGGQLLLKTIQNGQIERRFFPWRAGIKSPLYQDRLLRSQPMKPKEIRQFETFLPETGRISKIRLAAGGYQNVRLRNGKSRTLLRVRVTQSTSPNDIVDVFLDERGSPVLSNSAFVGKTMSHYTVTRSEALEAIAGAELDLGVSTLIRVPIIPKAHGRRQIVYRIYMNNGDPAKFIPQSDTQKVRRIDDNTVDVAVSATKYPNRPLHVRVDRKYSAPSRFLQSSDPRVREHAQRAAGYDRNPIRVAIKMEKYVHQKIRDKNFSTAMASAAEVARQMEGDCTEHAVLLAAMLRASGVPSRVAIGLVYVPRVSSFGAHMWTEAWLGGKWIPFDASFGTGGIGPAHIKLADASLADNDNSPATVFVPLMNVLGRWRIEVRSVDGKPFSTTGSPPLREVNR
ncbi:MAG: hypothetical protein Tsb009_26860 [Planctomycetaceae bacterium]